MPSSISQAAGQVLVAGFPDRQAPPELLKSLGRGELGGIILFKRNLGAPAEVAGLISTLLEAAPGTCPPLISVDQEGGRVARLAEPVLRLPPMRALGQLDDPDLTRRAGRVLGGQLAAIGFGCDFAPVLDVDTNPENPVIGDRAFAAEVDGVIRHGLAFAEGLLAAGVLPCGKHFPGHGDTELDSHLALPRLAHDRARLDAVELAPFRAAGGRIPMLMTAHVVFDALDPEVPATLSRRVIQGLLRQELRYDGVVVSDDLEMKAVSDHWGVPEAAVRAMDAGCDALLVCSSTELLFEAHRALVRRAEADGTFAARLQEAADRFRALRATVHPRPVTDPAVLTARLGGEDVRELAAELAARLPG